MHSHSDLEQCISYEINIMKHNNLRSYLDFEISSQRSFFSLIFHLWNGILFFYTYDSQHVSLVTVWNANDHFL